MANIERWSQARRFFQFANSMVARYDAFFQRHLIETLPTLEEEWTEKVMIIRSIEGPSQMQAVSVVELECWYKDLADCIPLHVLLAIADNGGPILGAYKEGMLVGFTLGWLGLKDQGAELPAVEQLKLVSHITGVLPAYRDQKVGYRLKLAQREWALARGLDLITWTFDPLESRNAHLNIRHLGATCCTYLRNVYGDMPDELNVGIESDRFRVDWNIAGEHVKRRLTSGSDRTKENSHAQLVSEGKVGSRGFLHPSERDERFEGARLLVEIPPNFQAIRRADLALAKAWRSHTRHLFEKLFSDQYRIVDLLFERGLDRPRSFYYLEQIKKEKS